MMTSLTLLLTLAIAVASPALAQTTTPTASSPADQFKQLDKNGDGKVSREELGDDARFKQYDQDGDGFVTFGEARAAYRDRRSKATKPAACRGHPHAASGQRQCGRMGAFPYCRASLGSLWGPRSGTKLLDVEVWMPAVATRPLVIEMERGGRMLLCEPLWGRFPQ